MIINKDRITKISFVAIALGVLAVSLVKAKGVGAQYYVPREDKRALSLDKKIRPIEKETYFDNISSDVAVFVENDVLEFKISVENVGNEVLHNIRIEDQLPANLQLIFHPGELNKGNNIVSWNIEKLEIGEIKNFLIRAKIANVNDIVGMTKRTNVATATADSISDKDDASYFVGVRIVPKTGDTTIILKTVLIVMGAAGGLGLRKIARGY